MPARNDIDRLISRPLTRRGFVRGGLAAAAAGAALGGSSCGGEQVYRADYPEVSEHRVRLAANGKSALILGGGFGGLHAACDLLDRGFKVTVLEKTEILGGKLKSWRDKQFGVPETSPDWPGYPRDHGLHAVWGSYNNLREFMGRHDYRLWKFPAESTIYNYVGRDGTNFQLGRKTSWPGLLGRFQGLLQTNQAMRTVAGADAGAMRGALLKMAAFDFSDTKQRMYLDQVSFPEWARSVGMPEPAIYKLFGANARMSMMDEIDNTSALAILSLSATVSGHPDDLRVDTFTHPAGETYVAPLAQYIKDRGGEIVSGAAVVRLNREGGRLKSVTAGDETATGPVAIKTWRCKVCGTVFASPNAPERCPVCGARLAQLTPLSARPLAEHFADYYVLALDIPGAKQVLAQSSFPGEEYFDNVQRLQETSAYTVVNWYSKCDSWLSRFPDYADFFPSGFKFLGITVNLAHRGEFHGRRVVPPLVPDYQNKNICVIETQIADAQRLKRMNDNLIARLVHEELKIVMPDLPLPADYYVNRWDNYSPQRVGYEALRPAIQSPLENLFLIGDWVKTDHLSAYMEKTYVAAKMAVNLILDHAGQRQGKMKIFKSGTPSAIISTCREVFSVYP